MSADKKRKSETDKAYRETHQEQILENRAEYARRPGVREHQMQKSRDWYVANHAAALERQAAYREPRREDLNEKQRQYVANLEPEVKRQRAKAIYANNREKQLSEHRTYYQDNREKLLARQKEYQAANKEARAAYYKQWREKNREKILAKKREYAEQNQEEIRARAREWQREHHDVYLVRQRAIHAKRRDRQRAEGSKVT